MTDMYSLPPERARNEYWLNQDKIPMDTQERLQRHNADCILALAEEVKKLREIVEDLNDQKNLDFMTKLYNIE